MARAGEQKPLRCSAAPYGSARCVPPWPTVSPGSCSSFWCPSLTGGGTSPVHPGRLWCWLSPKKKSENGDFFFAFLHCKALGSRQIFCYKWQLFAALWGKRRYPWPRKAELAKSEVFLCTHIIPSSLNFPSPAEAMH